MAEEKECQPQGKLKETCHSLASQTLVKSAEKCVSGHVSVCCFFNVCLLLLLLFSRGPSEKNPPVCSALVLFPLGSIPGWRILLQELLWGRFCPPHSTSLCVRAAIRWQEGRLTKWGHQEPSLSLLKDTESGWRGREGDRDESEPLQQGRAVRSFTFFYGSMIWCFLQLEHLPKISPQIWHARLRDSCVVLGGLG